MAPFKVADLVVLDQTGDRATAALIFLHGASESGSNIAKIFQQYFRDEGHPYFRCYLPTAPERYLTIRDKKERIWFEASRTGSACEDVKCSIEDAEAVTDMIESMITEIVDSGIPRERIILGGSSQGGMVSIYAAYKRGIKVGGIAAVSSGFPFYKQATLLDGCTTPMLSIYGQNDAFITPNAMGLAWQLFRSKRIPLSIKTLRHHGHDMDIEYTALMFEWLEEKLPPLD